MLLSYTDTVYYTEILHKTAYNVLQIQLTKVCNFLRVKEKSWFTTTPSAELINTLGSGKVRTLGKSTRLHNAIQCSLTTAAHTKSSITYSSAWTHHTPPVTTHSSFVTNSSAGVVEVLSRYAAHYHQQQHDMSSQHCIICKPSPTSCISMSILVPTTLTLELCSSSAIYTKY